MTKLFGPSWKPKVAAIMSGIGPIGIFFILTRFAHMIVEDARTISELTFSVLVPLGLATAKQDGVSNSPTPLAIAQPVIPTNQKVPIVAPIELAHPIPVAPAPDIDKQRFSL